jgi:putative peptidoglycan lipid II flippase
VTILAPAQGLHVGPLTLPAFGLGLYGMVYGVILGAAMHLLIQVPGLIRFQFRWRPVIGLRTAGVQRVLILLWPRVLTMASIQAYFVARDNLASRFGEAGIGALNLGWTIQQVPETVIGTAIAIALLPTLSEYISFNQTVAFRETVNRALRIMLALSLPAAALLAVAIRPLVAGFFGYETIQLNQVTWCTWAFLFGLLGDTWLETAVRSFYANQDTRTPLVAAFIQVISFILVAWLLSNWIGLPGIPLAAAVTFTIQAIVLLFLQNHKFPGLMDMKATGLRSLLAALVAGLVAFLVVRFLSVPPLLAALVGLVAGALSAVPFIWKEIQLLLHL